VIQVFSSGGGTQSCAIAALIVQGKLPKPDFVVIADTGREAPSTWEYLDAVVRPALAGVGVEVHRIGLEYQSVPEHGENWLSHNKNNILLPVFTNQDGSMGKLSNFCTARWKVEVRDRFLSQRFGITVSKFRKWIGFSFDEPKRWQRMMLTYDYRMGRIWFPLVELRMKRHESVALVERMGWPKPPRSRCWMCPNQGDYEWSEVKTDWPDKFAEAIALDESIRERDPHAFLHSSVKPLRDANLDKPDDLFSGSCPSGECFL
jgi:hypothetical protein